MANTSDGRIAILERRCEMLAVKLGLSCDQLDKVWPDYQSAKSAGARSLTNSLMPTRLSSSRK